MSHDKKNIMVILSSPSGVGKTTLAKKIEQKYQNFKISVSHTTRPPRTNEINGIDYHFIQKEQFEKLINFLFLKFVISLFHLYLYNHQIVL